MVLPKALVGPAKLGLAVADIGLTAAQQTAGIARDVVAVAADQVDPQARAALERNNNIFTAVGRIPYIVNRVADLMQPGAPLDRIIGPGGAADRVADLFNPDGPVDRVIRVGGPLDRATAAGGIVERLTMDDGIVDMLTAEDGAIAQLLDMSTTVAEIGPALSSMNARLAVIQDVVGAANSVAAPVTGLLTSLPRFAVRTAADAARAGAARAAHADAPGLHTMQPGAAGAVAEQPEASAPPAVSKAAAERLIPPRNPAQ
ncbi:hypothetical protein P0W64_04255 [Tsukamurella sp. 8F]|uniref:hypothetical protein n=1 Tax=unclassified Tsukamurella TaxID=2633480 RepID=UPI0023BA094B|nr:MULTISPECIES: hypothetical protein [unclassified Tsukamurella]MDF0529700.1 hypothetical protein [Tsukamurella sp. 8J]MDF0585985.1 hypothetical protein [Tsukamurella sp. 8F]